MKCARCSAEIPRQSLFCLRCGAPVQAAPANSVSNMGAAGPGVSAFPSQQRTNRGLIIATILLALALVGLLAWTVGSRLLQKPGRTDTGQLVQAPGQSGVGALVQAPGMNNPGNLVQAPKDTPQQPIVQAPQASAPNNADIDDYLKFVHQVELSKMDLTKKEMAGALSLYGNMLPNEAKAATSDEDSKSFLPNVNQQNEDFAPQWNKLTEVFAQRQPPEACISLRNAYLSYLGKVQAQFAAIHTALSNAANGDPSSALQSLTQMQGSASADADAAAKTADDELANICSKYHLSKDFTIQTDPSTFSNLLH